MGKVTRPSKPVKRYTRKKDSLGRVYTVDRKTGKRAANALWEREQRKIARETPRKETRREAKLRSERAQRAAETRAHNRAIRQAEAEERRQRALRGWKTRKAREIAIVGQIEDEFLKPLDPTSEQAFVARPFLPVERLGPEFGALSLKEKVRKYPKVRMRTLGSLIFAGSESQRIAPLIAKGEYTPSPEEWMRAALFNAYTGDNTEFRSFEAAAAAMSERFDKPLREVYELFFSPSVA